jgi:hypothetical protein
MAPSQPSSLAFWEKKSNVNGFFRPILSLECHVFIQTDYVQGKLARFIKGLQVTRPLFNPFLIHMY